MLVTSQRCLIAWTDEIVATHDAVRFGCQGHCLPLQFTAKPSCTMLPGEDLLVATQGEPSSVTRMASSFRHYDYIRTGGMKFR